MYHTHTQIHPKYIRQRDDISLRSLSVSFFPVHTCPSLLQRWSIFLFSHFISWPERLASPKECSWRDVLGLGRSDHEKPCNFCLGLLEYSLLKVLSRESQPVVSLTAPSLPYLKRDKYTSSSYWRSQPRSRHVREGTSLEEHPTASPLHLWSHGSEMNHLTVSRISDPQWAAWNNCFIPLGFGVVCQATMKKQSGVIVCFFYVRLEHCLMSLKISWLARGQ